MQITLNIPDFAPLTLNRDLQELKQVIKTNSALMLYKNSKLTIEQASRFAGLSLYDFMAECTKNQIPVIDYAEEELAHEMELMRSL
jgi:predicted HTH domain antitoxin